MDRKKAVFLVISDLHDQILGIKKIKEWLDNLKFDAVICCGDLTSAQTKNQTERIQNIINLIRQHHLPFFTIFGNNERKESQNLLQEEGVLLQEEYFLNYHLVGISGWGEIIPALKNPIDENTILVTHIPPKFEQKINLHHAPFLHLHGHIHMPYNKKVIGNTTIISVPPLLSGKALKITLNNRQIKTQILK